MLLNGAQARHKPLSKPKIRLPAGFQPETRTGVRTNSNTAAAKAAKRNTVGARLTPGWMQIQNTTSATTAQIAMMSQRGIPAIVCNPHS